MCMDHWPLQPLNNISTTTTAGAKRYRCISTIVPPMGQLTTLKSSCMLPSLRCKTDQTVQLAGGDGHGRWGSSRRLAPAQAAHPLPQHQHTHDHTYAQKQAIQSMRADGRNKQQKKQSKRMQRPLLVTQQRYGKTPNGGVTSDERRRLMADAVSVSALWIMQQGAAHCVLGRPRGKAQTITANSERDTMQGDVMLHGLACNTQKAPSRRNVAVTTDNPSDQPNKSQAPHIV